MDSPIDWLASRTPPAPDELKAWWKIPNERMDPDDGVDSIVDFLLKAGLSQLEEAVARGGREREAAHDLLAADALITYGCEAASESADVPRALHEILVRVRTGGTVA